MINKHYKNGFTLIETLVAISVLMIAIAGPLTVANKAYTSAISARDQSMAVNFAQEGLEYLNNMKDNLLFKNSSNVAWTRDSNVTPSQFTTCVDLSSACAIPIITDVPSPFTRHYYMTYDSSYKNEVLATVVVSWKTGLIENQVKLQELLTNYPR
ncbi:MAG: prepilin-type N-terminal cleavage/methylation domain-containing protein [Candidatus Paceibacterota bacterium]